MNTTKQDTRNQDIFAIDVSKLTGTYLAVWFSGEVDPTIMGLFEGDDPVEVLRRVVSDDPSRAVVCPTIDGWTWEGATPICTGAETSGKARLITSAERAVFLRLD